MEDQDQATKRVIDGLKQLYKDGLLPTGEMGELG